MKKILSALLAVLLLLSMAGCANEKTPEETPGNTPPHSQGTPDPQTPVIPPEPTEPEIIWASPVPANRDLTAKQYFVYNCETGEFLVISGEENEKIYPASVTKLFTAYVANQFLAPDAQITAGDALELVVAGSSVADIKKRDVLTTEMLVEAMLLPSGNDAAYILAVEAGRRLGKSNAAASTAANVFVAEMNAQAKRLGMTGTNFANPDGIHKDSHYTTFHDLAIMAMLSLEDPVILRYANVSGDTVTFLNGNQATWHNTNVIIDSESEYYCPYAIGLKTGQTPAAGSCLLSAFEYRGTTLVIGVFGCPEPEDRFPDTLQLLDQVLPQLP